MNRVQDIRVHVWLHIQRVRSKGGTAPTIPPEDGVPLCCAWNFFPSEVTFASNSQSHPLLSPSLFVGLGRVEWKRKGRRGLTSSTAATMKRVWLVRFFLFMPPPPTTMKAEGRQSIVAKESGEDSQTWHTGSRTRTTDEQQTSLLNLIF